MKLLLLMVFKEMITIGYVYKRMSSTLEGTHADLTTFINQNKKLPQKKKELIVDTYSSFVQQSKETEALRVSNWNKSIEYERLEGPSVDDDIEAPLGESPKQFELVIIGSTPFKTHLFNDLIFDIQQNVQFMDVATLIGNYKECYLDKDILCYLIDSTHMEEDTAKEFMNDLIDKGFLQKIYNLTAESHYQWKREGVDNEDIFYKIKRQSKQSAWKYKSMLEQTEQLRLQIQLEITSYMVFNLLFKMIFKTNLQHNELTRIVVMKDSVTMFMNAISSPIPVLQSAFNSISLLSEEFHAQTQISAYIQKNKTGARRLKTLVYKDPQGTSGVFGVELEDYCSAIRVDCPLFIIKCLEIINGCVNGLSEDMDPLDTWLNPSVSLEQVYIVRANIENENMNKRKSNSGQFLFLNNVPVSSIIGGYFLTYSCYFITT